MRKETKKNETMTVAVEYQHGSVFLYYDPNEQYLEPGDDYRFKTTGRVYQRDETGKIRHDEEDRPLTKEVEIELEGRVRQTMGGCALCVGAVPELELRQEETIALTHFRPAPRN